MWLLFYVIDSLSVKLLQEGKQAIQRQLFLHNATITDVNTDGSQSVGISQRVRKYLQQNATITDAHTDGIKSVGISQSARKHNTTIDGITDGVSPSVLCRLHILPTELPTDRAFSKVR